MKNKLIIFLKKCRKGLLLTLSIVSVITLLMAIWFNTLWSFLSEFQKSDPNAPVSNITNALKSDDYAQVVDKINNLPPKQQDPETYKQYIQENTNVDDVIYYAESESIGNHEKRYDIKIGKVEIMEVVMVAMEEKSSFDLLQYEMKSCVALPLTTYTIINYSDDQVLMNDEVLNEKYFVDEVEQSDNGVGIPYHYKTYYIDDLTYLQEVQLANKEAEVDFDDEKNVIKIYQKMDEVLQGEVKDFALTALHPYLIFSTANQGSRGNILQYVYPYSKLNYSINEYFNTYGMLYVSDELRNLVIDDLIAYSDTEFYCHVSLEYVVTQSDGIQKGYDFEKGFYITSRNGYYQLVDMVNE